MGQPGGTGAPMMFMLFWFPGIWIVTFIIATVLTVRNRKDWFATKKRWTIISFILCTPIPIMIIVGFGLRTYGTENGARGAMTMYNYRDGQRLKMQRWEYKNRQKYVDKYYKADSLKELIDGEAAFLKDSVWIYYDEDGRIIKKEQYKNDKLISTE